MPNASDLRDERTVPSDPFVSPFFSEGAAPMACLAWTLRLVIEDPKDPTGLKAPAREWIDCALSGRAVHELALGLPDWSARHRQSLNSSLQDKSLEAVKFGVLSSALISLGGDLLGGQTSKHSFARVCAIERPEHLPPEHFVGRLVVSAAPDAGQAASDRLAQAARGFAKWSQETAAAGHWAILAGEPSQLAWGFEEFGSNGRHESQLRFWKPRGREADFAAFFRAGLERATLAEAARPAGDEKPPAPAARAVRL